MKISMNDNYFERKDILITLAESVNNLKEGYRQNVAILGKGLIGKTSMLLHFAKILEKDKALRPIYINVSELTKKPCKNFFETLPTIIDDKRIHPVIILDEIDKLSDIPIKKPFKLLGNLITSEPRILFIVSSSSIDKTKKILSDELNLLFGNFKVVNIGSLNNDEALDLINRQVESASIPEIFKKYIIQLTSGHIFYLDTLLKKIIETQKDYSQTYQKHICEILAEGLLSKNSKINNFFSQLIDIPQTDKSPREIIKIIDLLSKRYVKKKIMKDLKVSLKTMETIIDRLLEIEIIRKNGSFYLIADDLFKLWVELLLNRKNIEFEFSTDVSIEDITYIESNFEEYKAENSIPFEKRIIELLLSFRNNYFTIGQKQRILPKLSFISKKRTTTDELFIHMSNGKKWLFIISNKKIKEEDIYSFEDKIHQMNLREAKSVIISKYGFEAAANTIAKQKQYWIWTENELNNLFSFFKGGVKQSA